MDVTDNVAIDNGNQSSPQQNEQPSIPNENTGSNEPQLREDPSNTEVEVVTEDEVNDPHYEEKKSVQKRINALHYEKNKYKTDAENASRQSNVLQEELSKANRELADLKARGVDQNTPPEELEKVAKQLAERKFEQLMAQREQEKANKEFEDAIVKIRKQGTEEIPDFEERSKKLFEMAGTEYVNTLPILAKLKDAHKIIGYLSDHTEETDKIFSLGPVDRLVELTRLENRLSIRKVSNPNVSRVDDPITPVSGLVRNQSSVYDKDLSLDEWMKARDRELSVQKK